MDTDSRTFRIHFETLGCRLNQIESESAARAFSDAGFAVDAQPYTAETPAAPDTVLCVINTCTVTAKAEQKARRIIRMLRHICPNAAILVTGCYAELDAAQLAALDRCIAVLKGSQKDVLADMPPELRRILTELPADDRNPETLAASLQSYINRQTVQKTSFRLSTDTFLQHSRASVKIQDGCNNSCTYCRIHLARGTSVSLAPEEVLQRIKKLEALHQAEVVLTGVNLSQYKGTLPDGTPADLPVLLGYILAHTHTIALRISSLYPERVDDALCRVLATPRIRPYFHLSVQSGSDRILAAMHRPYKSAQVLTAVQRLREVQPDAFIACDIIAGFPGETDSDFSQTEQLCRECRFTWIHAFPFSPRPGTPAFSMTPKIPQAIAGQRVQRLTAFAENAKKAYVHARTGTVSAAVVEKRDSPVLRAVCDNFLHVRVHTGTLPEAAVQRLKGTEIRVRITGLSPLADCDAEADLQSE